MKRHTRQLNSLALRQMQFQLPVSAYGALGRCQGGCGPGALRLDGPSLLLCLYLMR